MHPTLPIVRRSSSPTSAMPPEWPIASRHSRWPPSRTVTNSSPFPRLLRRAIAEEQAAAPAFDEEKWERARKARDKRFRVLQEEPGAWRVTGTNLERMVVQTDWENEEAIIYLQHRMARMGVDDALIKAGCKNGDEVRILGYAFDFEGIDDDEDYEDDVEFIEFDVDDEELATEDSQPEVGEEDPDVLA